ncbi:MAG: ComEC family competence protein, partial [Nitrospira sp.]|nr:ComEC family competence protein [Nitrospira sp.]
MLPSLTAAFLLGLFCGSSIAYFPLVLCGFLAGAAVWLTLLEQSGRLASRQALLLYGALLAGLCYWTIAAPFVHTDRAILDPRKNLPVDIVGRIIAPVQHGPGRQTALLEYQNGGSTTRRMRLVWRDPGASLRYGDRIAFRTKLHAPAGSLNPGGFDYAVYLERQGIDSMGTVVGDGAVRIVESGSETWRWCAGNRIDQWRAKIRSAAVATLNQPALGLFLGIIIGERGYLRQDLQEWFMATGTVHLLSISGSHLGLVALVVFWMVRRTALSLPSGPLLELSRVITPTRVAILVTWPIVGLYAWVAGAELATIRSLVMITLALAGLWLGHERPLYHAIAAAALLIVLHNPSALFDISFQLSFVSVFVLIQTVHWMEFVDKDTVQQERTLGRSLARYGRDAFVMSGAVTVATLPLVALYFNQVPWMGIVTNLLAVPFTGALLVPLGLLDAAWTVMTGG